MYLKYLSIFIPTLIKFNITKVILFISSIIMLIIAINRPTHKIYSVDILRSQNVNKNSIYTYKFNGSIKSISLKESQKTNVIIKDNKIFINWINPYRIVFFSISSFLFLLIFISLLCYDLDLDYSNDKALIPLIRKVEEDDQKLFLIGDRLIYKTSIDDWWCETNTISKPSSYRSIKKYPIYYTKQELREEKLKNLGI